MTQTHRSQSQNTRLVAIFGATALLILGSGCSPKTAETPDAANAATSAESPAAAPAPTTDVAAAPVLADPAATAKELLTVFLSRLEKGESVADLLAPNFQLQRADGVGANRDEYIADQAKVTAYTFGDTMIASQSGHTLSVRWSMKVNEVIDGVTYNNTDTPRLTAFEWTGNSWQMVSYAHFNPHH